jgi:hypothetical protein
VSANELQASYPIHDSVTLSDGTVVDMPFHVEGSLTTALLSVINTKWARQLINHSGFEPIEIKCNGINSYQGIGVLYFQDITRSPAGRYAETVNTIAVKRKSAPDLNLPCLEKNATKREKMQYLLGAMQILATANAVNQANNTPHDYAMFNQHLELNSQRAITAGVEIWGYPKSFANINHWMSDHYLSVQVSDEPSYKPILQFYYKRKVGTNTPLKAIGDNVLPERLSPSLQTKSQLSGVLSSDCGCAGIYQC